MVKTFNKYKPIFKKFISLRKNIRNNFKLLKFKKKKWQKLIFYVKRSNQTKKKYYKYFDNNLHFIYKFSSKFKNKYSYKIKTSKKFRLFYGNLSKKYIKSKINSLKHSYKYKNFTKSQILLYKLEQRLDTIIYRSHFVTSIRTARQLISHGHILVNGKAVYNNSYNVKLGDKITVSSKIIFLIKFNIGNSSFWPLPPKYLCINYKILEVTLIENPGYTNFSTSFPFWVDWNTLLEHYKR